MTSYRDIAIACSWWENRKLRKYSPQKVKRIIDTLCEIEFCKRISDTYGTHLTICSYELYQNPDNYKSDTYGTTMEQHRDNYGTICNKGNKDKKEKNNTLPTGNKSDDASHVKTDPGPKLIVDNKVNKLTKEQLDEWFDKFWTYVPRKVGKIEARRKFKSVLKWQTDTPTPEGLVKGMFAYQKWCKKTQQDKKHIYHPKTWLNNGHWLDELDFTQNKPQKQQQFVDPDLARSQSLSGV